MSEVVAQIMFDGALFVLGLLVSWAIWVTKSHFKARNDLDIAFHKIRNLEHEIFDKE